MTDNIIPYSFVPGTKAKAQEVNANFNSLLEHINTTGNAKLNKDFSNITETAIDIIKNSACHGIIGEIITSAFPLSDSSIHLLDGTLLSGAGTYADFVDYIADLYNEDSSADYFCTEADWQSTVTAYGICGKFVYDAINNTVRLPKFGNQSFTEMPSTLPIKGNGMTLGFTDGTNNFGLAPSGQYNYQNNTGVYGKSVGTLHSGSQYNNDKSMGLTTDATKSGMVTDISSFVNNYGIDCYYYVVIATTAKTDIQLDIDEIATDLNGKTDVDLTNVNNSGTSKGAGWAFPSNTFEDLTLGASGSTYTAPANGWVYLQKNTGGAGNYCQICNETTMMSGWAYRYGSTDNDGCYLPVHKGDVYKITYTASGSTLYFRFIYAKGSESEAS